MMLDVCSRVYVWRTGLDIIYYYERFTCLLNKKKKKICKVLDPNKNKRLALPWKLFFSYSVEII